jgi:hypothetical protein
MRRAVIRQRLDEVRVGLVDRRAVHVDLLLAQLDLVARQTDHALHEVAFRIFRKLEHHDVTALDRREAHLVDDEMVAHQEIGLHRPGRNLERLKHPRAHEQREDDRDDQRLEIFAND